MTIQQAIARALDNALAREVWLRPISYRGTGSAFAIQNDRLMHVPSIRGGYGTAPHIDDLLAEWETVDPWQVNAER